MNKRLKLIEIFKDTEKECSNNPALKEAIKHTRASQVVVPRGPLLNYNSEEPSNNTPAQILVTRHRTLEAASLYKDKKVCILNFANAYMAGGGVVDGCTAQEECLCRCSTLYECLTDRRVLNDFHIKHTLLAHKNRFSNLANRDCIYSPDVVVFKTDELFPEMMDEADWYKVNVITCAAPDLRMMSRFNESKRKKELDEEGFLKLHVNRARRILEIAKIQGNQVVILGAFGCGAFENPPEIVAQAYENVIQEFKYDFETIEFAIYSSGECRNFDAFNNAIL